jgi:hypothetical protein
MAEAAVTWDYRLVGRDGNIRRTFKARPAGIFALCGGGRSLPPRIKIDTGAALVRARDTR